MLEICEEVAGDSLEIIELLQHLQFSTKLDLGVHKIRV